MPLCNRFKRVTVAAVRSPNLRLASTRTKEFLSHPRTAGEAVCPYRLVACGFNFDAPKSVFPEYLASLQELVMWRFVVAGTLMWEPGQHQTRLEAGTVLATHQPTAARLVVGGPGVSILWVLLQGAAARQYFDQITGRFGVVQVLAPGSAPVRLAEELVRAVRAGRPRPPFFWSEQTYRWLSSWHAQLERRQPPAAEMRTLTPTSLRLLPAIPRTVKSLARQLGYSPSYLARQIGKRWTDTPGRLLRQLRMEDAARRLCESSDPVHGVAAHTGYASVPAFINAFRRAFGCTPLAYRHRHRGLREE